MNQHCSHRPAVLRTLATICVLSLAPALTYGQSTGSAGCSSTMFSQDCGQAQTQPPVSMNTQADADSSNDSRSQSGQQTFRDTAGTNTMRTESRTASEHDLPPDPLTDFQKVARESTGTIVPIFGRDLFRHSPSTFAPGNIPITADYVVGPGDQVLVRLFGVESTSSNSELTVDASGNIYLPRVGSIQVAGLRVSQLQDRISQEVGHTYRNFRLSVSIGHLRSVQIYVVGDARRPGAYTVSSLSTVMNALFASGGPSPQGSMRRIQVRRKGVTLPEVDLYDLLLRGDKSSDARLETGDVIFIPPVGPQVVLAGSVRHPAVFEAKGASTVDDLLTLGGGFSATGAGDKLRLERVDKDFFRHATIIRLDAVTRTMALQDGDILYADHVSRGYEQSVTIRGNLANPGRFGWHEGMLLSEIIPDQSSLLTNNYWQQRNRLGVPTPMFEPAKPVRTPQSSYRDGSRTSSTTGQVSTNAQDDAVSNGSGSSTERRQGYQDQYDRNGERNSVDAMTEELADDRNDPEPMTADSAGVALQGVQSEKDRAGGYDDVDSQLRATNKGTEVMSADRGPRNGVNGIAAQARRNDRNEIRLPAPEINWTYAAIERLDPKTLKTSIISFNLGKLVQNHDQTQNLQLQPGDVITILSQRDIPVAQEMRTKYIRLQGEFASAGVYSVGPNEDLAQVVARAGGVTSAAYLYGSSFTRESSRVLQQQRLDEYVTQLSTEMERATAVRGVSSASGVSDPTALLQEHSLINQLRSLRATGRILMEFKPDSEGTNSVPHLTLEDGDVFSVPRKPDVISVLGAVYGQNVMLWNPKRHLADYVSFAGNANRIADKDHAFIIRADGSVYSRETTQHIFSNRFNEAQVFPGDAIVIPEKLIKPTALRQFIDYSQILSSFGLAAAAINVIR